MERRGGLVAGAQGGDALDSGHGNGRERLDFSTAPGLHSTLSSETIKASQLLFIIIISFIINFSL